MSGQFLKKQRRDTALQSAHWLRHIKRFAIPVLILGGIAGLLIWLVLTVKLTSNNEIIARSGIHWHPELSIYIKGQLQEIPANVGLGVTHNPIHTHDATGVIHLEFSGLVLKDNLKLGNFFKIWGKNLNKDCIMDYCGGPEGAVKMSVNGELNFDFENYLMRDGDKIEIRYE